MSGSSRRSPRTSEQPKIASPEPLSSFIPVIQRHPPSDANQQTPPVLSAPSWIGPVSFVATVAASITFIPVAWAFIIGFAVFVCVEAALAKYKSTWYRPTTVLEPVGAYAGRVFDNVGNLVAASFDVAWWLDVVWTFLRHILPLDALWTATVKLITVLITVIFSPVKLVIGFMRRLAQSRNPMLSASLLLALLGIAAVCVVHHKMPWELSYISAMNWRQAISSQQ